MPALRANEIYKGSGRMLIAIESVDYSHFKTHSGCHLYGHVDPIAVIVCGSDGIYAVNMAGELTAMEQLRQGIPELDAMIASFDLK